MKVDILTLFPEVFSFLENYGVIGRSIKNGILDLSIHQIRDFAKGKHKSVDDTVYGGSAGMLMRADVVTEAIESVKDADAPVIFLSPRGQVLTQDLARDLAKFDKMVLLCGHYEGIDQRVIDNYVDFEISIGDYVLTGGEIPAMVVLDSLMRWVNGVLGNPESAKGDSHADILLQYDEYTKPRDFRGYKVPEILLSGDHGKIAKWRHENAIERTKTMRPDLYKKYLEEEAIKGGENGLHQESGK